jgi:hypothetical protein
MDGTTDELLSHFDLASFVGGDVAGAEHGPTDAQLAHPDHQHVQQLLQIHHQSHPPSYFMNSNTINDDMRSHEPPMMSLQPQGSQAMNIDATLRSLLATQSVMLEPQQQMQTTTNSTQALLEQQVRIAQLHQLQQMQNQLQHQIFQQQVSLLPDASGRPFLIAFAIHRLKSSAGRVLYLETTWIPRLSRQIITIGIRCRLVTYPLQVSGLFAACYLLSPPPPSAPSTELRAHHNTNYVSPMILHNYNPTPADTVNTSMRYLSDGTLIAICSH